MCSSWKFPPISTFMKYMSCILSMRISKRGNFTSFKWVLVCEMSIAAAIKLQFVKISGYFKISSILSIFDFAIFFSQSLLNFWAWNDRYICLHLCFTAIMRKENNNNNNNNNKKTKGTRERGRKQTDKNKKVN